MAFDFEPLKFDFPINIPRALFAPGDTVQKLSVANSLYWILIEYHLDGWNIRGKGACTGIFLLVNLARAIRLPSGSHTHWSHPTTLLSIYIQHKHSTHRPDISNPFGHGYWIHLGFYAHPQHRLPSEKISFHFFSWINGPIIRDSLAAMNYL